MPENIYLSQLKAGHCNGQETIRFIDQKASIVFGVVVFVISSVFFLYQNRFVDEDGALAVAHCIFGIHTCIIGLAVLGLAFLSAILCAACMISCLRARPPMTPRKTILFPYYTSVEDAQQLMDSFKHNQDQEQKVIEEYEDQLVVVGTILERKIYYFSCLMRRFIALVAFASLLVCVSWIHLLGF